MTVTRCRSRCCPTPPPSATGASSSSAGATLSSSPASSARRSSSTTRPTCGPGAARPSPPSAPGSTTPPRPSSARAMARLAAEEGCNLDVSTGGEYHVARAAGVPAERLVLHGNNKCLEELRRALSDGVGRIVIDSLRRDRPHRGAGRRGPARPQGAASGSRPASRPTPTSSSAPARTTPSSASALASGMAEQAVQRAAALAGHRSRRPPRPHRLPGLRGPLLRAGRRGPGPLRRAPRPARALARRWPRRRLRRG